MVNSMNEHDGLKVGNAKYGSLKNADPKDDGRSCGHSRDAHSGKTCSQCYSGRKYSHTFTEKGEAPVPLGDLDNAEAMVCQSCWMKNPEMNSDHYTRCCGKPAIKDSEKEADFKRRFGRPAKPEDHQ